MDTQTTEIPAEVQAYLEGLLQDANMQTLDDDMRREMIKELYARLDTYLASVIADNLPPEHFEAFLKMNEEKKPRAEIDQFLKDKLPNSQELFAKAFADFREMYLGNLAISRNAPEQAKEPQTN